MAEPFPGFLDWMGQQIGNQALSAQGYDPQYMRFLQGAQQAGGQAQQLIPQGVDPQKTIMQALLMNAGNIGTQYAGGMAGAPEYDAYKGMFPYNWKEMPVTDWKGNVIEPGVANPQPITQINPPDSPHAGFFSSSPEVASRFAAATSRQGAVYPSRINFNNPLVIDAKGKPAAAFQFESVAKEHGTIPDYQQVKDLWGNPQYDGLVLKNTADEGDVYVPRVPEQIKSLIQLRAEEAQLQKQQQNANMFGQMGQPNGL